MTHDLPTWMQDAARLTRAGKLQEVTQALQRSLGLPDGAALRAWPGMPADGGPAVPTPAPPSAAADILDGYVTELPRDPAPAASPRPAAGGVSTGRFAHGGRTLDYRLFLPTGAADAPRPLVLMLHGCTQNPEDFAAGTGMDALAQAHGCAVLYPAQDAPANPQRCWNWFKHNHQQRGRGEPDLLAALARSVVQKHGLDPRRVYVAGLSAGGAMAAILAQAYPDVFAAAGVHSGLAQGTARDAMSALQAMRTGTGPAAAPAGAGVPTIVFHGDADATVHPDHGAHVMAAAQPAGSAAPTVETGRSPGGRRWTRTRYPGAEGGSRAEYWQIHGAGHAWAGGRSAGTYTDPAGPDASAEMLRFFLAHRLAA
ncbi:extracellular catalytic domain type 1 short-chain-length polyhydroxyalkanoate depolymerase [Xylophilus ampelinus]|uniref:Poly(Hydroxyalkanoate) depolymerase family esterase n=1 Tax=Xylophilus ampelinus TaxID=54067 RepID=A0A318SM20_9BURK|nr:PHB depolymerase family esterase [Xylophilus ampelinus]MCS4510456.1 PHB depolymerase family esterase [Xylophilus ampelinus]PYE77909.1 poly(hydroxyalkanoate) depolymerase family esterase [Xylophilus ampelinus]